MCIVTLYELKRLSFMYNKAMKRVFLIFLILAALVAIALAVSANKAQAPVVPIPTPTPEPVPQPTPKPATKDDMIVLDYPLTGAAISSPLTVRGKARGNAADRVRGCRG